MLSILALSYLLCSTTTTAKDITGFYIGNTLYRQNRRPMVARIANMRWRVVGIRDWGERSIEHGILRWRRQGCAVAIGIRWTNTIGIRRVVRRRRCTTSVAFGRASSRNQRRSLRSIQAMSSANLSFEGMVRAVILTHTSGIRVILKSRPPTKNICS